MPQGRLFRRDISSRLLASEGEVVVDEVTKHWVTFAIPFLEAVAAVALWGFALVTAIEVAWLPILAALGLLLHAGWGYLTARLDLFVVTNMRVFRISGVVTTRVGSMPLMRILDIAMIQPVAGRLLGYGHLVFESAAQEQGMRDIKFVPRPVERDLLIQRVIQRSGLRAMASDPTEDMSS